MARQGRRGQTAGVGEASGRDGSEATAASRYAVHAEVREQAISGAVFDRAAGVGIGAEKERGAGDGIGGIADGDVPDAAEDQ